MNSIFKNNLFYISLLLLTSIVTHWYLFFDFRILNAGDWLYVFDDVQKHFLQYGLWIPHTFFGVLHGVPPNLIFNWLFGLLSLVGTTYDISTRIFFLVPIVFFTPITSYLLFKHLFRSSPIAFVAALMYCFNTFFMRLQLDWITYAYIWWILPLLILLIEKYLLTRKYVYLPLISLLTFLGIVFEVRVMLIVIITSILYSVSSLLRGFKFSSIIRIFSVCAAFILGISAHLFWLLPMLVGLSSDVLSRASPIIFATFYDLQDIFTLHAYTWSHNLSLESFVRQPIDLRHYLIPIVFFIGVLNFLKHPNKGTHDRMQFLFWSSLLIMSLFVAKQSAPPFTNFYDWSFHNIPLFNLFRESSKFMIIVALSITFFFTLGIQAIFQFLVNKFSVTTSVIVCIVLVFFTTIFNSQHFVDQKIGGMAKGVEISQDYKLLARLMSEDLSTSRNLWVPRKTRFGYYSSVHPSVDLVKLEELYLAKFSETYESNTARINRLFRPLQQSYSDKMLDSGLIKYVIVPSDDLKEIKRSINTSYIAPETFRHFGQREEFVDRLDKLAYLKKVSLGTSEIVVFENTSQTNYFYVSDMITDVDDFANFHYKYSFIDKNILSGSDFIMVNETFDNSSQSVSSIVGDVRVDEIMSNMISSIIENQGSRSKLYLNDDRKEIEVVLTGDNVRIYESYSGSLSVNGFVLDNHEHKQQRDIFTKKIDTNKELFFLVGNRIGQLSYHYESPINFGFTDNKTITVFSSQSSNIVSNPSFESGLWDNQVGDCNAYDDRPILDMKLSTDQKSEGNQSLQLEATRHIACTSQRNLSVTPNSKYLLSFDYQSDNARQAGYYVSFNDEKGTVVSSRLPISDSTWQTFRKIIDIPEGATTMSITVYSYSQDEKTNIITRSDNFQLYPVEQVEQIQPTYEPKFVPVELPPAEEYKIELTHDTDTSNRIRNSSFEQGLWSEQVGDCNNYDDKGKLGMQLVTDSTTDGSNSLQLEATRHIACTGPGLMPVVEDRQYLFSFDYQTQNAKQVGYYLGFNDEEKTVISERIPVKKGETDWKNFTKTIKAPAGATAVSLTVYGYSTDGKTNIITRYDNFHLIELPDIEDRFYLVSEPERQLEKPKDIQFQLINPTLKTVQVKGATTPFYLNMSEAYHPQWQAQFENEKNTGFWNQWIPFINPDRVKDEHHYKLNNFLNGWYIDTDELCKDKNLCTKNADGSYDLQLRVEFFPQRWFYLGLLISGTTLAIILSYLGFVGTKWGIQKIRERNAPGSE